MKIVIVIIKLLSICFQGIMGEPDWTYYIDELDCTNKTPHILNLTCTLDRISRGVFAVSGSFLIAQDLTDETMVSGELFYSAMGHTYVKTPFHIPEIVLSEFINTFYRDLFLDSLKNCTENAPLIATDDPFVAPLTKRDFKLDKCFFSNSNMPSSMRPGYYKHIYAFKKQVDSELTVITKIESK